MHEKLGKDNAGYEGVDEEIALMPARATSRYPEKSLGCLNFDVAKAKEYTKKSRSYSRYLSRSERKMGAYRKLERLNFCITGLFCSSAKLL